MLFLAFPGFIPLVPINRERIRQRSLARMEELHLSRGELARRAGVTADTVGDFLNGNRWPQYGTLNKIEKALELPSGEFPRWGSEEQADSAPRRDVSGVEQALTDVLLDLPESALEGLSPVERDEVRASATEAALRKAREIRRERG